MLSPHRNPNPKTRKIQLKLTNSECRRVQKRVRETRPFARPAKIQETAAAATATTQMMAIYFLSTHHHKTAEPILLNLEPHDLHLAALALGSTHMLNPHGHLPHPPHPHLRLQIPFMAASRLGDERVLLCDADCVVRVVMQREEAVRGQQQERLFADPVVERAF